MLNPASRGTFLSCYPFQGFSYVVKRSTISFVFYVPTQHIKKCQENNEAIEYKYSGNFANLITINITGQKRPPANTNFDGYIHRGRGCSPVLVQAQIYHPCVDRRRKNTAPDPVNNRIQDQALHGVAQSQQEQRIRNDHDADIQHTYPSITVRYLTGY